MYHKAGRKGSAARGKRKKICLFRQMACTIPCGRISALSGLPIASHLPQRGRRVSAPCLGFACLFHVKRGLACPKLWVEKSACPLRLAYGKPPPPEGEASFSILPWVFLFVSRETRTACLKPWAGTSACPLQIACRKPPPPEGEASFRAPPWVCLSVSRETEKAAKLSPRRLSCGK